MKTWAWTAVSKLNAEIAHYSTAYCHCHSAMQRLGADQVLLNQFQVLNREDIQSSMAIIDPNEPGSSSLQLS